MKKIAIISPGFLPVPAVFGGGVEQLITLLIEKNEFNDKKIIIDLYTTYDEQILQKKYINTNIIAIKVPKCIKIIESICNRVLKKLKIKKIISLYNRKVAKIIKDKHYDRIVIENNMYLFKEIYKKYKLETKFLFHLHNDIDNFYKPPILCEYIGDKAYKILTVSNYIKDRFLIFSKCKSEKVQTLYNCIDINNFCKPNIKSTQLSKKYNISDNELKFLYVGRYDKEKGLLELIKSFSKIQNQNIKLLIVGKKEDKINKYQEQVQIEINKDNRIVQCGYVSRENIYSYFSYCDIIIIPTLCEEAFGLVAIEAMAASKPLIITNSGGMTEIVNEKFAKIINKKDFENTMINAINFFIENKNDIKKMGHIGYATFYNNKNFDSNEYYNNFIKKIK